MKNFKRFLGYFAISAFVFVLFACDLFGNSTEENRPVGSKSWTFINDNTFVNYRVSGITYDNDRWIAFGGRDYSDNNSNWQFRMAYSNDGITWTRGMINSFAFSSWGIVYGNGIWGVAGGLSGMGYSNDNGLTWNPVMNNTLSGNGTWGIAYGNGSWVIGGSGARLARSDDGINWIAVADSTFPASEGGFANNVLGIAYGNGRWVAGDSGGRIAYSDDNGVTWTAVMNSTFSTSIRGITFANSRFVAVGMGGRISYSPDGIMWQAVMNSTFDNNNWDGWIESIIYGNGRWVAIGNSGIMAFSDDNGVTWTRVTNRPGNGGLMAYGNGRWLSVSGDGIIAFSDIDINGNNRWY